MKNKKKTDSRIDEFEKIQKLGRGSFGEVFKVRRKVDNKIYVMKYIDTCQMSPEEMQSATFEAIILAKIDSEYVCKYYDSFMDNSDSIIIIMEYCEGGDLQQYLKKQQGKALKEERIWKFFIEMCLGLHYLHYFKILHRDIKSMNIFLGKDDKVKIGDLGVAKQLNQTNNLAHTVVGTPYYLSPELCEEKPYNNKSDIWSLGCVLYELCTFRYPFEATNRMSLMIKILRNKQLPIPQQYSEALKQMTENLLIKDQRKRPSLNDIFKMDSMIKKMKEYGYAFEEHQNRLAAHKALSEGKIIMPKQVPSAESKIKSDELENNLIDKSKNKKQDSRSSAPVQQSPKRIQSAKQKTPAVKKILSSNDQKKDVKQQNIEQKRIIPAQQKQSNLKVPQSAKVDKRKREAESSNNRNKSPNQNLLIQPSVINQSQQNNYKNPYIAPYLQRNVINKAQYQQSSLNFYQQKQPISSHRVRNPSKNQIQARQVRNGENLRQNNENNGAPQLSRAAQNAKLQGKKLIDKKSPIIEVDNCNNEDEIQIKENQAVKGNKGREMIDFNLEDDECKEDELRIKQRDVSPGVRKKWNVQQQNETNQNKEAPQFINIFGNQSTLIDHFPIKEEISEYSLHKSQVNENQISETTKTNTEIKQFEVNDQFVIIPDFKVTDQIKEIKFEQKETRYEFELKEQNSPNVSPRGEAYNYDQIDYINEEEAEFEEDENFIDRNDLYLQSVMDFMDINETSNKEESNEIIKKDSIQIERDIHNNFMKIFGDKFEDDIRQSLHRMQKDFYGDQNDQIENFKKINFETEHVKDSDSNIASSSFVFMEQNEQFQSNINDHSPKQNKQAAFESFQNSNQDSIRKQTSKLQSKKMQIMQKKLNQKQDYFKQLEEKKNKNKQIALQLIGMSVGQKAHSDKNFILLKSKQILEECINYINETIPEIENSNQVANDDKFINQKTEQIQQFVQLKCENTSQSFELSEQIMSVLWQIRQLDIEIQSENQSIEQIQEKINEQLSAQ